MAEAEQPERLRGDREVTVDDIRQLVAPPRRTSLPDPQPDPEADQGPAADDPVRLLRPRGDREAQSLGFTGEVAARPSRTACARSRA